MPTPVDLAGVDIGSCMTTSRVRYQRPSQETVKVVHHFPRGKPMLTSYSDTERYLARRPTGLQCLEQTCSVDQVRRVGEIHTDQTTCDVIQ